MSTKVPSKNIRAFFIAALIFSVTGAITGNVVFIILGMMFVIIGMMNRSA